MGARGSPPPHTDQIPSHPHPPPSGHSIFPLTFILARRPPSAVTDWRDGQLRGFECRDLQFLAHSGYPILVSNLSLYPLIFFNFFFRPLPLFRMRVGFDSMHCLASVGEVLCGWGLVCCMVGVWRHVIEWWRGGGESNAFVVWTEEFLHFFRIARIVAFPLVLQFEQWGTLGVSLCLQLSSRISGA